MTLAIVGCSEGSYNELAAYGAVVILVEVLPELYWLDEPQRGGDSGIEAKFLWQRPCSHGDNLIVDGKKMEKMSTMVWLRRQSKSMFLASKTCHNSLTIF